MRRETGSGEFFSNPASPRVQFAAGFSISGGRVNYVCNAHSYHYHDSTIVERAGDQGDITFFPPAHNRAQIEQDIINFVTGHQAASDLADAAYDSRQYEQQIIGIVEIGCRRRPGSNDVYLTHYVPGGNRIPVPVLKAIWKLLRL